MTPIPRELVLVRRLLEASRAGVTYAGIARDFNAEGVPTKRGARWHASTVRGIVQRRAWYADILGGFLGVHLTRPSGRVRTRPTFSAFPAHFRLYRCGQLPEKALGPIGPIPTAQRFGGPIGKGE